MDDKYANPKRTTRLEDDEDNTAYEAAAEHPPALKVSIGIIELVVGSSANAAQVATSTLAWISMIMASAVGSLSTSSGLTSSFPWISVIGFGIAIIVQATLHMQGQAISSTWARLRHIQNFHIKSTHAAKDVMATVSARTVFGLFALSMDIVSDSTFINLFTHNFFVILAWMIMLTGGSTLLLYDGATRVWGAMEDFKDYHAYHEKFSPKEK